MKKKRPSQRMQEMVNRIISWGGDGTERGINIYFASRLERLTVALFAFTAVLVVLTILQLYLVIMQLVSQ